MGPDKLPDEHVEPSVTEVNGRVSAPELPEEKIESQPETSVDSATEADADDPAVPEDLELEDPAVVVIGPKKNIFKRFGYYYRGHKKWTIPVTLVALLAVPLIVPYTRYSLLGLAWKNDFSVLVLDETTNKPVTNASVMLAGIAQKTDNKGQARLRVKVGHRQLSIQKKYYRTVNTEVLVPVLNKNDTFRVVMRATGRQVPVTVTNSINGQPVENALVRAADTEARTNKKGETTLVLPADKATISTKISVDNYNEATGDITVTDQVSVKNHFTITPAGKVYFLSNLSGKLDAVKTNLDGTDRQTVVAGTGNESNNDTILLASRDWKYLAFKAKRDNGLAKLYLIDTATSKMTTIDEGDASFSPVGWYGGRFAYLAYRNNISNWQPYAQALKSYDATSAKLTVIDQTTAEGSSQFDYGYTNFSTVYILQNELVYAKNWFASGFAPNHLEGKTVSLVSVRPDGSAKKTIKDFAIPSGTTYSYSVNLVLYGLQSLYVQIPSGTTNAYYAYEGGKLTSTSSVDDQKFFGNAYPTYLVSPSDSHTFWAEARDGKNVLFVGDQDGKNSKQVAALSDYTAYGWYGDDYLLVSKNSSELYIMPIAGGTPIKVTDYHKPVFDGRGYSYGYGGL